MNTQIIAIANQKGGVGKTTTTSNLGIGLAKQGKKVLLIDADAQGSLTASLGFTEPDSLEVTLATIMGNLINDGEVEPGEGILHHEEGIDLMPGNIELSGLEVSLVNVMSRETVLRSYIEIVRENYDYILIDCMPSLGMITINAFASADSILIPVQAAYLPVKGLPLPLLKSKGALIYHMNVVCAVLQTAFCACRHKRKRRELPAERSAARGNLPLQYQSHIPRQGQIRCCRRRLPGGGENHKPV